MTDELRQLHLCGATGQVRIEQWQGRDHIVVPVIALMEGVIHAVNATTPEFVPAATLARAAASWNGRPVVLGHPVKNGRQCSANAPDVWTTHGIGTIFNSRIEGKKLLQEAWIDKARVLSLNKALHDRLLESKPEEVSVGAHVVTDGVAGQHNGKRFMASWRETTGDHLAFLPGGRGACSIEMGCGAHRAAGEHAVMHLVTAEGIEIQPEANKESFMNMRALRERFSVLLEGIKQTPAEIVDRLLAKYEDCPVCKGSGNKDGNPCETCNGDGELKVAAGKRNNSSDQTTIQGIHDHTVTLGADCGDAWKMLSEKIKDGTITVGNAIEPAELRAACSCDKETDMTRTERIAALLKHEHNPLKDQKALEAADDKAIVTLEAHCANAATLKAAADKVEADKASELKAAADAKTKETEDLKAAQVRADAAEAKLKAAEANQVTDEMRALVAEKKASDAAHKSALVAQLKTAAAEVFTEEELNAKPIAELLKLAQMAKVEAPRDFSGRGLPAPRNAGAVDFTPPNPYEAGIKALQGKAN